MWCLKYQKTLIISGFQCIYWSAHRTATLTSLQYTVPPPLCEKMMMLFMDDRIDHDARHSDILHEVEEKWKQKLAMQLEEKSQDSER